MSDEQKELTYRQELFVREYLVDFNASAAARRSGYSEKSSRQVANVLFARSDVKARIKEEQRRRCERVEINADWVLSQAAELHKKCMQAEPVLDKDGMPTGEYRFDSSGAARALEIVGKHIGVQAFLEKKQVDVVDKSEILERARERAAHAAKEIH